ncbi:DUF6529 family protein [Nocardia sp. NBC_00565]|uniref:DUF6529 family protein n=1 Tax=Nocardia sp. NBC_00565 TaxID=2975993 RepID=UPI002E7FC296|nr:DUF6529 family protein [Nocardia sp. NBC_00565]WUC07762.1 DUF6529 family protein [Nocardia sp. NBC_00565]
MSADREAPTVRVNPSPASAVAIIVPVLVGAAAAVLLGVYAKQHDPRFFSINVAGFSSPVAVKTWLATLATALALFQFISALAMYGKLNPVLRRLSGTNTSWVAPVHVWSGRLAVLVSVPVAVHCLYALGFQDYENRVLIHSLLGCFFYGAFVAKMLLLTRKGLPGWVIPVAGGLVLAGLTGIWLTSALWFFQHNGVTF